MSAMNTAVMIADEPPRPTPNGMSESYSTVKLRRGRSMPRAPAVAVQADDKRLDQADSTVVSEAVAVADQRLGVVEGRAVAVARHHSEEGRLVDGGLRAERVEQE